MGMTLLDFVRKSRAWEERKNRHGLILASGILALTMGASVLPGWLLGVVVAAAVVLAVPLSIERYRRERNLARAIWRALTAR